VFFYAIRPIYGVRIAASRIFIPKQQRVGNVWEAIAMKIRQQERRAQNTLGKFVSSSERSRPQLLQQQSTIRSGVCP